MSAQTIFEHAPIGAIISWSDGSPRPPDRHRRKLDTWTTNNSRGRLIRNQGTRDEADYGAGGVIAIRVHRTFAPGSRLSFTIVERPAVGSVRVFDRTGVDAELVHLAPHRAAAEQWLTEHGYPNAVLEDVTAEEAVAEVVEERAVA